VGIPCAVILAGGQSRRMLGQHKASLDINGTRLAHFVAHRLNADCHPIAISYNGSDEAILNGAFPCVLDVLSGSLGPLAGIHAAMTFAQQQGADRVITVAVDTPFFPDDFVSRMTQVAAPIALAQSAGRVHPTCGIWSVSLISDLETYLMSGQRRLWDWATSHGAVCVDWSAEPWDPFFNINTPDDYAVAMTKLAE